MTRALDDYLDQQDLWAYDDGGPEHCEACGKDRPPEDMGEVNCLWCETNWPKGLHWTGRINECVHCEKRTGQLWNPARRGWMCQRCGGMVPTPQRQAEIEEATRDLVGADIWGR